MTDLESFFMGTWQFEDVDERTALALVETAHDVGITRFDTASVYAGGFAEIILGRSVRPGDTVLTKVPAVNKYLTIGRQAYPHAYVEKNVENSIRRLGRAPNIVLLHNWHVEWERDRFLPLDELRVIADDLGVEYIGMSLPNGYDGHIVTSPVLQQIDCVETPFNARNPRVTIECLTTLARCVRVLARSLLLHGADVSGMHQKFAQVVAAGCAPVVGASSTEQIQVWKRGHREG